MLCPKCGAANSEDKKFCGDCGASLQAVPTSYSGVTRPTISFLGAAGAGVVAFVISWIAPAFLIYVDAALPSGDLKTNLGVLITLYCVFPIIPAIIGILVWAFGFDWIMKALSRK